MCVCVCMSCVYAQNVDINDVETGRVAGLECSFNELFLIDVQSNVKQAWKVLGHNGEALNMHSIVENWRGRHNH